MLTENQQKWVDALRSDKYKQGRFSLQSPTGFCCLGVACKVAEENGVHVEYCVNSINRLFGGCLASQPDVQEWLQLKTATGKCTIGYLSSLNDSGSTFSEIADIIEQNSESLFYQETE